MRRIRHSLAFWLALVVVGAGAVVAVIVYRSGGKTKATGPTATATRGDVVVDVGAVGRVVAANAVAPVVVPATPPPSGAASASAASPAQVQPGGVFPGTTGHVAQVLVSAGQHVAAGESLALLNDGGAAALAVRQARNDVAVARLELLQKQTSDPTKGLPPTTPELAASRLAVSAARQKLALLAHPTAADLTAAALDAQKGRVDLETVKKRPTPMALIAAKLTVTAALRRLEQIQTPSQTDVTAVQLEVKRAQADLDALQRTASPAAIRAARLAVELARQRLADLPSDATRSERLAAELELARAEADLEALLAPPNASALAAAKLALDLAEQRLAQLTGLPSPAALAAAQADLAKVIVDLDILARDPSRIAVRAAELAVRLGEEKLAQLRHPPPATRAAAKFDVAKAVADLETLRRRGAPAGAIDLELARLKLRTANTHLTYAQSQVTRLVVRAPAAGTVTSVLAVPGSPADASTPVATVADLSHVAVTVDLSEFDVSRVRLGLPALVSVDALGGRRVPGRVESTALTGVDSGGVVTFPVRVTMRKVANVRPGMNVSVRIIVSRRLNVVEVPLEAVSHDVNGHAVVSVVATSGRTATRRVVLGLANNKNVEIRRGLRTGERVLLARSGGA